MINYSTKFIKTLEKIEQGKRNYEVFADFCNIAAISLVQPFIKNEKLENEYLTVINRYKKGEIKQAAAHLARMAQVVGRFFFSAIFCPKVFLTG